MLTLYGTEIWHYAPRRFGVDLFTRAYRTRRPRHLLQRVPARSRDRVRPAARRPERRLSAGRRLLRAGATRRPGSPRAPSSGCASRTSSST
ncbi:MAG: hypothetical protein MZU84_03975 [Sphingobacterium sp.]|nr:hypothetical protein [Sphingobacterium sp.]